MTTDQSRTITATEHMEAIGLMGRALVRFCINLFCCLCLLSCDTPSAPISTEAKLAFSVQDDTEGGDRFNCADTYSVRMSADKWKDTCKSDATLQKLAHETFGLDMGEWAAQEMAFRERGCRVPIQVCLDALRADQVKIDEKRMADDLARQEDEANRERIATLLRDQSVACTHGERPTQEFLRLNPRYADILHLTAHLWRTKGRNRIAADATRAYKDENTFAIHFLSCPEVP